METSEFISKLKSRYLWVNILLMGVAVVAVTVLTALGIDVYTHHGEAIEVPDLRNRSFDDAEHLLKGLGLQILVNDTSYNRQLAPDCVLQQMPLAGEKVKSGRIIYVTINSSSKPTLVLPDIIDNSSQREAMAKLRILGFKVGESQLIPGEKDWVYGVICHGRRLVAGDHVSIDDMIILQVGNGTLSADANLEVTDAPPADDIITEETGEVDPFEEVTGP